VLERTSEYFAPELLNRLDSILVFNKLSRESILKVVSLGLKDVADRLRDRRITLDVDDGAKDWLAKKGYSDVYGARAIARVVRTKVGLVGLRADLLLIGDSQRCSGFVSVGPKNAERCDTVGTSW
jgi:ATP-dependent Clp protease ATP-binding subunit ClpA